MKLVPALLTIFKLAIFPIIGMIFHPAYHIINTILLGHMPDDTLLAALGLGGLTVSIVLLAVGISLCGALDTLIAQAYGQGDLR
jgi:Na+-driven multidrug efflux pump